MKRYDAVLFWLGGVLVPTLPELTMALLTPGYTGHDFVFVRQQLRALAEETALGKLSPAAYCEASLAVCKSNLPAAALERELIAAAALRQPLAQMIDEIPATYER